MSQAFGDITTNRYQRRIYDPTWLRKSHPQKKIIGATQRMSHHNHNNEMDSKEGSWSSRLLSWSTPGQFWAVNLSERYVVQNQENYCSREIRFFWSSSLGSLIEQNLTRNDLGHSPLAPQSIFKVDRSSRKSKSICLFIKNPSRRIRSRRS